MKREALVTSPAPLSSPPPFPPAVLQRNTATRSPAAVTVWPQSACCSSAHVRGALAPRCPALQDGADDSASPDVCGRVASSLRRLTAP